MKTCAYCGNEAIELRAGCCYKCASDAEAQAAKRTFIQHFVNGALKLHKMSQWWQIKYDWKWAIERATRTGDYKSGGYFDRQKINWR